MAESSLPKRGALQLLAAIAQLRRGGTEKVHSRLQKRLLPEPCGCPLYLREELDFPGVRQVVRVDCHPTELNT